MNELQVIVNQEIGHINFNYEEIREELRKRMDLYKDAVFTEDSKNIAKGEVAALRKMKAAIDQKRKDVKNQFMVPYNDFEKEAKELMALIDEPISLIDGQIKAFEEKRKAEKREKIWELYEQVIGDLVEYLPFEKIYDAKWDNASRSMKSIKEDLESLIDSTKMAKKDFHCHACGANGDIFDFVMWMDGLTFKEAFQSLGGVYEKPSFSSALSIYQAKKCREMKRKIEQREERAKELNQILISIYRKYLERFPPLSDGWCDCYNRLQMELYRHSQINGVEGR